MHTVSRLILLALIPLMFWPQMAMAEVFKCTTADGKTSYSAAPCTAAGAREVVVPIMAAPPGTPSQGRDWAAENAAVNARVRAADEAAATRNAQKASESAKSPQEIIAECEANHGVNCTSDKEIAKRESNDRALTPEEAEALHRASAGRQENERQAAEAKKKSEAAAAAAAATAAKPPIPAPKPSKT
jgi:hypothetical protein